MFAQKFLSTRLFLIVGVSIVLVLGSAITFSAPLAQDPNPGVNDQPDITLPSPAPDTTPGVSVALPGIVVSDVDVGAGNMELEIDISDLDGVGGLSVPAGDYGTFTWGFGTNVTTDVSVTTLAALNAGLATFTFNPGPGFAGLARIIFEIDDQGNSGTGGVLSRTRFIDIDVCAPSELGTSACGVNNQPDVILPGTQTTPINTPISFTVSVSDIDVGTWDMELEIDISDLDGVGGLSVPAGDYGTFTWGFGTNVTTDVAVASMAALNGGLVTFTYTPDAGYTGLARVIFEIDDQGNSGEESPKNILSRTRFIDINVVAETFTPTSTNTPLATGTPTNTNTPLATGTPTNTSTPLATGTPTNTSTPLATGTPTNTDTPAAATATPTNTDTPAAATVTPTSTDAAVNTPTATATADGLNTATATGTADNTAVPANPACLHPILDGSVQGRVLITTIALYEPNLGASTDVLLPGGSSWWIIDAEGGFYELWIACFAQPVWVPAHLISPNFDTVWNGAPLPDAGG